MVHEQQVKDDLANIGHKEYMDTVWWNFLPLYIFIAVAIINLVLLIFGGANAGAILTFVIGAFLMGLLIWWLCDIGQLGWAWFVLLLPVIWALFTGAVGAGVTGGLVAHDAMKSSGIVGNQ
jgi:hypothetical protein